MTTPAFLAPEPSRTYALKCARCNRRYSSAHLGTDWLGRVCYDCPDCGASPAQQDAVAPPTAAECPTDRPRTVTPSPVPLAPPPKGTIMHRVLLAVCNQPGLGAMALRHKAGARDISSHLSHLVKRGLIVAVPRTDGKRGATYVPGGVR